MASTDSNEDKQDGKNDRKASTTGSNEVRKQEIDTGYGKVQVYIQGNLTLSLVH